MDEGIRGIANTVCRSGHRHSTLQQPCWSSGAFNQHRDQHGNTGFVDHCRIKVSQETYPWGCTSMWQNEYQVLSLRGKIEPNLRTATNTRYFQEKMRILIRRLARVTDPSTVVHGSVPGGAASKVTRVFKCSVVKVMHCSD
jgi:hypothetical protein